MYDNEDILLELDGANVLQARYTHGPGIDEPLVMLRGTQSFFYHADGLGSVWDLTNSTGTVARSYVYDSFGQILAQTGTVANPYTYTGRELDPETGFYYYRARYYDPSVGRFMMEDPLRGLLHLPLSLNAYPYVSNNPIHSTDPDGQAVLTATLLFLGAKALAIGIAYVGIKVAQHGANLLAKLACDPRRVPDEPIDTTLKLAAMASVAPAAKLAVIEVGLAGPTAVAGAVVSNPKLIQEATDFVESALVPGPPRPSGGGIAGFTTRRAIEEILEDTE